jgi:hypothetical protein
MRVKSGNQSAHIALFVSAATQILQEPANRHIGDGIEAIKSYAISRQQLAPEIGLD